MVIPDTVGIEPEGMTPAVTPYTRLQEATARVTKLIAGAILDVNQC